MTSEVIQYNAYKRIDRWIMSTSNATQKLRTLDGKLNEYMPKESKVPILRDMEEQCLKCIVDSSELMGTIREIRRRVDPDYITWEARYLDQ